MAQTEVMPVQEQRIGRPSDPCVMVIFGAAGDLTRRKLIPALYNLAKASTCFRTISQSSALPTLKCQQRTSGNGLRTVLKNMPTETSIPSSGSGSTERIYYVTGEFDDKQMYVQLGQTSGKD